VDTRLSPVCLTLAPPAARLVRSRCGGGEKQQALACLAQLTNRTADGSGPGGI
jgi:hypothetical protein